MRLTSALRTMLGSLIVRELPGGRQISWNRDEMEMALNPLVAAKRVCELRDWSASNLEINKILYLAQMVFLGRNNGTRPLVSENFEAWDYGPVLPSVYYRAKTFGKQPVQNVFRYLPDATGEEAAIIAEAVESVRGKTPGQLVAITHWEKGAWATYYKAGSKSIVIPNEAILEEYRKRAA